jgi:hypothetical protein
VVYFDIQTASVFKPLLHTVTVKVLSFLVDYHTAGQRFVFCLGAMSCFVYYTTVVSSQIFSELLPSEEYRVTVTTEHRRRFT